MSLHIESIPRNSGESFRLLRWRDNLKEVEHCYGAGRTKPVQGAGERWHLHREVELTLVERGHGVRVVGDDVAPFSGPELVLLGPHLPHCWHGLHHSTGCAVQFHWPLDHPLRSLPELSALGALWQRAARGILFSSAVTRRVREQLAALADCAPLPRLGLFLHILGELAAVPSGGARLLSRTEFGAHEGLRHEAGIGRVIRHVLEQYAEPHPLSGMLRLAGMSKATFARQFPRFTGCTFTEFLCRVRLERARQRIFAGDDAVATAAFAVGFNHLSHFNRSYRRLYSMTPSDDRRRRANHTAPKAKR
jgi:AraC-like DNA-binding protein